MSLKRTRLAPLLAFAILTLSTVRAGTTVVNRTANDLFVAFAIERSAGRTYALDDSHPGHMETTGWFKLNRYGDSKTVPYALVPNPYTFGENAGDVKTYILVEGEGGVKMRKLPQGSRTFPIGRPSAFSFKWSFPDEPDGPRSNGRLAAEASRQNLKLETFAPMAAFSSGGTVELTMDNLGWNGDTPPQNPQVAAGARRIEQITRTFIREFSPIAGQVPEGEAVLRDAQVLADAASHVTEARTKEEAEEYMLQVGRAWYDLYARLKRASGDQWGPRSRPLLQITDIIREMRAKS